MDIAQTFWDLFRERWRTRLCVAVWGLAVLLLTGCSGPAPETGTRPAEIADAQAEAKAVAFVKELRGEVTRDDEAPGKPVVKVDLRGTRVTDAGLKELAAFKGLTYLNVCCKNVTSDRVKDLQLALPNCVIDK